MLIKSFPRKLMFVKIPIFMITLESVLQLELIGVAFKIQKNANF